MSVQQELYQLKNKLEDLRSTDGSSNFTKSVNPLNLNLQKRRDLRGHFGKVYSIHWAGKESHSIVSASQDGKLIVWNADTTNKIQAIPLRSSWVMTCAYEQEANELVACGGLDNICSVFRLNSADSGAGTRPIKMLAGHDGYLSCCRFMGQGHIVTSSGDSTCRYWDVEKNECLNVFTDHPTDVMSVSPHPHNNSVFVSGSCDTYCKLWDIRAPVGGKVHPQATFRGHESDINSTAFFPDGNAFGTGSDDASCRLFDIRCYKQTNIFKNQQILCGITSVAFSSSGRVLFGGYDDFNVIGWDTLQNPSEDTEDADYVFQQKKHENRVSCVAVQADGKALATGSWDTLIKIWA